MRQHASRMRQKAPGTGPEVPLAIIKRGQGWIEEKAGSSRVLVDVSSHLIEPSLERAAFDQHKTIVTLLRVKRHLFGVAPNMFYKVRVINKRVSIPLNLVHLLISSHLLDTYWIFAMPLQQHFERPVGKTGVAGSP